ncbi:MAG TPA: M48 family metalloprotease [Pseudomonadales bacterium]
MVCRNRPFKPGSAGQRPRRAALSARLTATFSSIFLLFASAAGLRASPADDLPSLGDGSSSIVSPAMEKRIGREFLKQINAMVPTIDDPILKYYVGQHIAELSQYSELREKVLEVVLIDSPAVNAFAAPGGVVGVNLGLLLIAEDVHEYSSVIAHEIAHLSQRHFARGIEEQRAAMLPTLASMIAAIAIGMAAGGDAGLAAISASQAAAQSNQLRYSRSRETEADRIGMNTLINAGMDPDGMARMFDRMGRAYRYTTKPPEFLLTHPLTDRRVADAKTQAMQYPRKPYPDAPDYTLARTRAIVHYADSTESAVKRFRKEVKDNPESSSAQYGLALALSRAGKHDEALPMADALFSSAPDRLLFVAAYAEFLTAAGEYDQALTLLERQLLLNPDNPPLAMLYAAALEKNEEYDIAESVLRRQSEVRPNDVDVWYHLAEVSGKAGDIVAVHRARAEYFALHGAYNRAIQHLEYARRLVSQGNTKLLAMLDQRISDLRTELRIAQS